MVRTFIWHLRTFDIKLKKKKLMSNVLTETDSFSRCLIIVSNCLLTAVHTLSALIVYAIYVLEGESMDAWGRADYVVFICKTITCGVEVLLALNVVCYGILTSLMGESIPQ